MLACGARWSRAAEECWRAAVGSGGEGCVRPAAARVGTEGVRVKDKIAGPVGVLWRGRGD